MFDGHPSLPAFLVLGFLLTSCASMPPAVAPTPERAAEEPAAPAADAVPEPTDVDPPPAEPAPAEAVDELAVAVVPGPPSIRDALESALEWTAAGLRLYEQGRYAEARDSLNDARIALLEADLPEAIQERGPAALAGALPEELRGHDVAAVVAELDAMGDGDDLPQRAYVEREARRILRRFGAADPEEGYLAVFVDQVEQYVRYYQGHQREFFERAFERKHKYWPTIQTIFAERGIPEDLGYVAFVESGMNPHARSHAGARGLWQFIPSTGKIYHLRHVDDFYDVVKATEAASEYLLDLIGIFGSRSFLLATAAYNVGERRIERCLRDLDDPFGSRSFWEIRGCLPPETREYVPRILAAAVVASDPARFGFDLAGEEEMKERYDVVTIPVPTRLSYLAERSGTSVAELRTANTDLATNATSTPVRNFPLYVPRGGGELLARTFQAAPGPLEVRRERAPPPPRPSVDPLTRGDALAGEPFDYEARRGDTLEEIARGFGVTVEDLKDWNPFLRQRVLYRGDRLRVFPASGGAERRLYRVRSGDTLSAIAESHGLSYRDLARWNSLRSPYRLKVGQELVLHVGEQASGELIYRVRQGNTLGQVAEIFSVRYRDVMRWNGLVSSRVRAGQELVIHPPRPMRRETYTVRRGDTVARIARRFGVPVAHVLTANGLRARTVIRPGQRLVVYVRT